MILWSLLKKNRNFYISNTLQTHKLYMPNYILILHIWNEAVRETETGVVYEHMSRSKKVPG